MRMIERKITEAVSERSYAHHEKIFDLGDTFKEKSIENRVRNVENRVDRIENISSRSGMHSSRYGDKKIEYIEEKLIETTDIAINAEKKSLLLEQELQESIKQM